MNHRSGNSTVLYLIDTALNLHTSYLSELQRVEFNGKRSSGYVVKIRVSQSSILGPFLFAVSKVVNWFDINNIL